MRALTAGTEREAAELRKRVRRELKLAGFRSKNGRITPPDAQTKDAVRSLHLPQRLALLHKSARFIDRWEDRVLNEFGNGAEVVPARIRPVLTQVHGDGYDAALFRFATLHWSVPVSVGYGRRTRFLVHDDTTGYLIGVFALGDPVYNLRVRDELIGWGTAERSARLYSVLDAFVLGALPPYRELLGAKLIAMAALSNETADHIEAKYQGGRTVIREELKPARPVLITATSALGRSSIYNRLKFRDRLLYERIGLTQGYGHFQFSDALFRDLCTYLRNDGGVPSHEYGGGPNWRMRTLRQALSAVDLDPELLRHGIRREAFIAPMARNWRSYLRGETDSARWYRNRLPEMAAFYRRRWAVPRSERDSSYLLAQRDDMRISPLLEGTRES